MSITTLEIQPDVLSATAVIGASIVSHTRENLGKIEDFMIGLEKERVSSTALAGRNKDHCRRFIQKIFNEGQLPLIWNFMSPDVVNHELADALGDGEPPQGHSIEWMEELVHFYRRAFPDLHLEIQDQIAEGDRVVTCLRMRGTQKDAFMTIPASGRKIDITGIRVDRMADGKIVESWFHLDVIGMLRQLDALPSLNRSPRPVAPASRETVSGATAPLVGWPDPAPPRSEFVS